MNNDSVAKFFEKQKLPAGNCVRIDFKKRNPLFGFLIQTADYEDLKTKNFWRFVLQRNMQNWQKTGDMDFARIYNGAEFTKLSFAEIKELSSIE
ncbi:MAG: short-chain dehydrogenase [Panacibacter sp.]